MNLLYLCACQCPAAADSTKVCLHSVAASEPFRDVFSPLTTAVPRICGWVVLLLALYFVLKYVVAPLLADFHDLKTRKELFKQEKFWKYLTLAEKPIYDQLLECKSKLEKLEDKEKKIDDETKELNKDREEWDKKCLEERVKIYEEIIKSIK